MFYCVNLRKKNCNLTFNEETKNLKFNDETLKTKRLFQVPASLSSEHAFVMAQLETPYQKKNVLLFRTDSWLVNDSDDADDEALVGKLNTMVEKLCGNDCVLLTHSAEARLHKTTTMNDLYPSKTQLVAPKGTYLQDSCDIDVIFCERVTSYTKSFDMSLVLKNGKVITHSCISRKKIRMFSEWAEQNSLSFYQTGPDPLPWTTVMNRHREGESWESIYKLITHVSSEEEESSEWEEGNTDEDDEEEELDLLEEEEEEEEWDEESNSDFSDDEYEPDAKRRKT